MIWRMRPLGPFSSAIVNELVLSKQVAGFDATKEKADEQSRKLPFRSRCPHLQRVIKYDHAPSSIGNGQTTTLDV